MLAPFIVGCLLLAALLCFLLAVCWRLLCCWLLAVDSVVVDRLSSPSVLLVACYWLHVVGSVVAGRLLVATLPLSAFCGLLCGLELVVGYCVVGSFAVGYLLVPTLFTAACCRLPSCWLHCCLFLVYCIVAR